MYSPIVRLLLVTSYFVQDKVSKVRDEEGATAVEYGLLVGLIAAVLVTVVALLGTTIAGMFQDIVDALTA